MDIALKKRPWYVRYRYCLITGVVFAGLIVYVAVLLTRIGSVRVDAENLNIATVEDCNFLEYVDVEGIVHPIMTVKVNAMEAGFVDRIVAGEGTMLREGDTILVLKNPELIRSVSDELDEYESRQRQYREQEIEMSQKTLTLQQQALDAAYEMGNLDDKLRIAREEYDMGMKSKAEIEIAENEYAYRRHKTELQMQSLRHDSAATVLRREMLGDDLRRAATRRDRALSRFDGLCVLAPVAGQLSYLNVTPGQQVAAGAGVCEIKVLSDYKIHATVNEYYIDRLSSGLPAAIVLKNERYPLMVSKVVPEITDRSFKVEMVFTGEKPATVRIGKSFRVQIELGQPESTMVIPRGDFYTYTNGKWIYRITPDGKKAVRTEIELGRQNPRQYEVVTGLNPGDRVVVSGYDRFGSADEIIISNLAGEI